MLEQEIQIPQGVDFELIFDSLKVKFPSIARIRNNQLSIINEDHSNATLTFASSMLSVRADGLTKKKAEKIMKDITAGILVCFLLDG